MIPFLNKGQDEQLHEVLISNFKGLDFVQKDIENTKSTKLENMDLINKFISAKGVEGCTKKTLNYYKETCINLLNILNKPVEAVNTEDIRDYLTYLKQYQKNSKTTLDNNRRIFSSFFGWLEIEDYILKSPIKKISKIKQVKRLKEPFNDEDLFKLQSVCKTNRDKAILNFLLSTGVRIGELVGLDIDDIDFTERECVVFGKGEKERTVYFNTKASLCLQHYINSRDDDNPALFVSSKKPVNRLGINAIETSIRGLGKKAGVPNCHPHRFRRTMATMAIDKGMPIEQVKELLGHSNLDTTMIYAQVKNENVKFSHHKFLG